MDKPSDEAFSQNVAAIERGCIVAAAGCGKTEHIARAVAWSNRRRLVLTHTHAGVDAIKGRLSKLKVPTEKYCLDTIAGWCLRFATSFPQRSGVRSQYPSSATEWDAVYAAASRLLQSGAVSGIVEASYGGLFVDEYQDCSPQQHAVICLLAQRLPACVFGDPLQAIFDFGGQMPVDWQTEVFPTFPQMDELTTPWRWKRANNIDLANWLQSARRALEAGRDIDLRTLPECVQWTQLPSDARFQQQAIHGECLKAIDGKDSLVVIGNSVNEGSRAVLARNLSQRGFSTIEAVSCKDLYKAARALDGAAGQKRFDVLLGFASECMTGTEKSLLEKAVASRHAGGRAGQSKFGDIFPIIDDVIKNRSPHAAVALLDILKGRPNANLFRREMFYALRAAICLKDADRHETLASAVTEIQNKSRHIGRKLPLRCVGSTLLVKGLEFDHAVVVHSANMSAKNWYCSPNQGEQVHQDSQPPPLDQSVELIKSSWTCYREDVVPIEAQSLWSGSEVGRKNYRLVGHKRGTGRAQDL